jgi:SAM-dependent methyltransferase
VVGALLKFSSLYQALQDFAGAQGGINTLTRDYLRIPAGSKVLDIGCGTGYFRKYLPDSVEYVGIDVNPRYIAKAEQTVKNGRFYVIGERADVIPEREFDFSLFIGVLHHLANDVALNSLRLAASCLKEEGTLYALEPVRYEGQGVIETVLMSLDRGKHIRTTDKYRELLSASFPNATAKILPPLTKIPWRHCLITSALGIQ